jgi:hypothetical protein
LPSSEYLIDNPNFSGRYTPLIPHYLFAVLFAKVQVLTRQSPLDANLASVDQ